MPIKIKIIDFDVWTALDAQWNLYFLLFFNGSDRVFNARLVDGNFYVNIRHRQKYNQLVGISPMGKCGANREVVSHGCPEIEYTI